MGVFRFSKKAPLRHGEDGGGGVAVIEPASSQQSAPQPHSNAAAPQDASPFAAQMEQLDIEDRALAALEEERLRLIAGRDSALAGVAAKRNLLAKLENPVELAAITDSELDQHAARLRQLLRELGLAEKALEAFTAQHPDVLAQRAAWNERREKLEREREKFEIEEQWFSEVAPALEAALLKLADWHMRRFVANRAHNVVVACGLVFEDPPTGPLSLDAVKRVFRFLRCFNGRESDPLLQKPLELARGGGAWPSMPVVTWR